MELNKFKRGDLVRFTPSIRRMKKGDSRAIGWTADIESEEARLFSNAAVTGHPDRTMIVLGNHTIINKFKMVKVMCNQTAKVFFTYGAWVEATVYE